MQVNDQIEISNGFSSYYVPKTFLCSKNPHFNKFCEKKFTFQLDETNLKSLIEWIYSGYININLENAVPLYEFSRKWKFESIRNECWSFFNGNFTIKDLPIFIKNESTLLHEIGTVQHDRPLINLQILNTFLSRNFLRIINGEHFLDLSLEVVKYIFKLDLCIESEYQVFQGIKNWIKHDESRIVHLEELMSCIRWCFVFKNCYSKIKADEFITQNIQQLDKLTCDPGKCLYACTYRRVKEELLFSIRSMEIKTIDMSYYTGRFPSWQHVGTFDEDDQMSGGIFKDDEHVVDIIFDSGRKGLRFDSVKMKYRWLEMSGSPSAYYYQMYKCFKPKFNTESTYKAFIQDEVRETDHWVDIEKNTLIENKGVMNIIGYKEEDQELCCLLPVDDVHWFNAPFADDRVHAVVINDIYYIITKSMTFRIFDSINKTIEKSKPFEEMGLSFHDLQLDSHKSNVTLLIKSKEIMLTFDTLKKAWSYIVNDQMDDDIIALTSTDIPFQFIMKLNNHYDETDLNDF